MAYCHSRQKCLSLLASSAAGMQLVCTASRPARRMLRLQRRHFAAMHRLCSAINACNAGKGGGGSEVLQPKVSLPEWEEKLTACLTSAHPWRQTRCQSPRKVQAGRAMRSVPHLGSQGARSAREQQLACLAAHPVHRTFVFPHALVAVMWPDIEILHDVLCQGFRACLAHAPRTFATSRHSPRV